ncbi:MAG: c-type cytochrome [Sulfurimonas sp.]|nr:c-type cytochrome [Sulfurimonas sp.]MDQ7060366.1 c-type cytochrome [Sulfurimonas sp.]
MNKIYLWGFIVTAAMLGFTYVSVLGSKGGLNGDIVNMLTVAAAAALVVITVFVVIKYVRQMQVDTADGELAEHEWDGIGEYLNPIPTGWGVLFLLTMVWAAWYWTMAYPPQSYSQIGEYNEDVAAHDAEFTEKYKTITGDRLVEMGESVFLAECKVCHGLTADGIEGTAANLNVRLEKSVVQHVIENGSNHNLTGLDIPMPDRNGLWYGDAAISDAEIDVVSSYVANGMTGDGAVVYTNFCSACHGAQGKGGVAAPNIATFDMDLVINVLNYGKKGPIGTMPAFDRLNKKQKEAAGAYVSSLSE